ncbi:MAG: hypothetical protein HY525_04195 [Betaproteobacteria bacterium]|nr:hypothetical protein [Betaproteobacteria bacterium]
MQELTARRQEIPHMIRGFMADSGFPPTRADHLLRGSPQSFSAVSSSRVQEAFRPSPP